MIKGHLKRDNERIDFTMPESWNELTLETYERIKEDNDALEVFSVLADLDLEFVKMCDAREVEFLVSQIEEIFKVEYLENNTDTVDSFTIRGRKFIVPSDILGIKAGQYWDIRKIEESYQGKPIEAVRKLISFLAIEEGKEYDYKDTDEKYELFKELDVETAFKIRTFFLTNLLLSINDSNLSLIKSTRRKNLKRVMTLLVGSMVAYLPSIVWLKIKQLFRLFSGKKKR
jgi:hypothetical protein